MNRWPPKRLGASFRSGLARSYWLVGCMDRSGGHGAGAASEALRVSACGGGRGVAFTVCAPWLARCDDRDDEGVSERLD